MSTMRLVFSLIIFAWPKSESILPPSNAPVIKWPDMWADEATDCSITATDYSITSVAECKAAAEKLGLAKGGLGFNFQDDYTIKGCAAYNGGPYHGHVYWGTGGSDDDMKSDPRAVDKYAYRPKGEPKTVCKTTQGYPWCARVHEEKDYGGGSKTIWVDRISRDDPDFWAAHSHIGEWNDTISSVQVNVCCYLAIYRDPGFRGFMAILPGRNSSRYGEGDDYEKWMPWEAMRKYPELSGSDNQISSYRCWCRSRGSLYGCYGMTSLRGHETLEEFEKFELEGKTHPFDWTGSKNRI